VDEKGVWSRYNDATVTVHGYEPPAQFYHAHIVFFVREPVPETDAWESPYKDAEHHEAEQAVVESFCAASFRLTAGLGSVVVRCLPSSCISRLSFMESQQPMKPADKPSAAFVMSETTESFRPVAKNDDHGASTLKLDPSAQNNFKSASIPSADLFARKNDKSASTLSHKALAKCNNKGTLALSSSPAAKNNDKVRWRTQMKEYRDKTISNVCGTVLNARKRPCL